MGVGIGQSYTDTLLWQELQRRATPTSRPKREADDEAHRILSLSRAWLDEAQTILAKSGTQPPDFTLHDENHAFRVAQRMAELLPSGLLPQLSNYELLMLLLAAYLHDIGMAPGRGRVRAHYTYLLTGNVPPLNPEDLRSVRQWLDAEGYSSAPPVPEEIDDPKGLRKADELTAYYCRYKHNDWSEAYILEHLPDHVVYRDWRSHLVMVCSSHHHGYEDLVQAKYDPVSKNGATVHLRYLAALLRVADILENDPERTPPVLLEHRGIASKSQVYWWKDHYFDLRFEERRFSIHGRPAEALIHKAILDTANSIEAELRLVEQLDRETHFDRSNWGSGRLPHRWDVQSAVMRDVKPQPETYEYIDGSFQPDTKRLLDLLSGTELYQDPLVAVRELVQNAFDAVRERIARQRLRQPNPANPVVQERLAALHEVTLRLEKGSDGLTLICTDTGMGMTRRIIERHLLTSGAPRRGEITALERACTESGFRLERTGQFGIGVLSYFMLANQVTVVTARSQEAGDTDGSGWLFTTTGVGSFGELRRTNSTPPGTEVRLRLRPDQLQSGHDLYPILRNYLINTLVHLPCRLRLEAGQGIEGEPLEMQTGWAADPSSLQTRLLPSVIPFQTLTDQAMGVHASVWYKGMDQSARELLEEARQCLRWETTIGEAGDGSVRYRLLLPYFLLPGGKSLAFMRVAERGRVLSVLPLHPDSTRYCASPHTDVLHGWKGMRTIDHANSLRWNPSGRDQLQVQIDLDWQTSATGTLSVSRNTLRLNRLGQEIMTEVRQAADMMMSLFIMQNAESCYATLNSIITGKDSTPFRNPYWLQANPDVPNQTDWGIIRFPATNTRTVGHRISLNGRDVAILLPMDDWDWKSTGMAPDRVVLNDGNQMVLCWTEHEATAPTERGISYLCEFPDSWTHAVGYYGSKDQAHPLWNRSHPLVQLVEIDDLAQMHVASTLGRLASIVKQEGAQRPSRLAAWILSLPLGSKRDINAFFRASPSFLGDLLDTLYESTGVRIPEPLCWLRAYNRGRFHLYVLDRERGIYECWPDSPEWSLLLPDPGQEWTLKPSE